MQTTIPEVTVDRANVGTTRDRPALNRSISVGRLLVTNAKFGILAGQARLRDVHVTVGMRFELVWSLQIPLPWPFDDITIAETTTPLGTLAVPFAFGDADVPGLQNINLNIPQFGCGGGHDDRGPGYWLQLTGVVAEGVRAFDIALPTARFGLAGLGLTGVSINQVGVPAMGVRGVVVRQVKGAPVTLPALGFGVSPCRRRRPTTSQAVPSISCAYSPLLGWKWIRSP